MKGLVGIVPKGALIFISQWYTGSVSDRQLVIDSGLLRLLENIPPGKSIMADKGFEIPDLLVKTGHLLNIPPLKCPQLFAEEDVQKTESIARVRIHVERAIGQVKKSFHIFESILPFMLAGSINQIRTVRFLLSNCIGPLIADQD